VAAAIPPVLAAADVLDLCSFAAIFSALGLRSLLTSLGSGHISWALLFAVPTAWGIVMAVYASRLGRAGVYTSTFGVRVRNVVRIRTVPWSEVAGFSAEDRHHISPAQIRWGRCRPRGRLTDPIALPVGAPTPLPFRLAPGGDTPARAIAILEAKKAEMTR
jgi:hypothetical protein